MALRNVEQWTFTGYRRLLQGLKIFEACFAFSILSLACAPANYSLHLSFIHRGLLRRPQTASS